MTNLAELVEKVETIPDATPEQHAALRPYVEQHAPDLVEALWGAA